MWRDYKQLFNVDDSIYTPRVIILLKDQIDCCDIHLNANI